MFNKRSQNEACPREDERGAGGATHLAARLQAVILAFAFLPGLVVARHLPVNTSDIFLQSVIVFAGTLLNPTPFAIAASGFAGGVLTSTYHGKSEGALVDRLPETTLEGTVLAARDRAAGKLELLVKVNSIVGQRSQKVSFTASIRGAKGDLMRGDRVRFRASVVKTGRRIAPLYRSTLKKGEIILIRRPALSGALGNVRRIIISLASTGPEDAGAVLSAIAAGRRGNTPEKLAGALRGTGTYHLLAISGVHVASALLVGIILSRLLGAGLLSGHKGIFFYLAALWCGGLLVIYYLALTGMSPSSTRAAFFMTIFFFAAVLGRESSFLNNIALSFIVISALSSRPQPDLSLCLSIAACLGIASSVRKGDRFIIGTLRISMGAFLATLPLITVVFRGIPALGPLFNVVAVIPFAFVLIPMAVLGDIFAAASPGITAWVFAIWKMIATPVLMFLERAASIPWAWVPLNFTGSLFAASSSIVSAFLWLRWKGCLKRGVVLILVPLLFGVMGNGLERAKLRNGILVTFPGIGQSDAAIVETAGKTVLVDSGPPDPGTGRPAIARFLDRRGIKKIDVLFLTHNHPDHTGGAGYLLRHYIVKQLVLPHTRDDLALWQNVLMWCPSATKVSFVKKGDRIVAGNIIFRIFWPGEGLTADRNDLNRTSLLFEMLWGKFNVLFTGDSPWENVISAWKETGDLDVLKVPHHGSASGFKRFSVKGLSWKMPAISLAVCPARKKGSSSLPAISVANWFERRGIPFKTTGIGDRISIFYSPEKTSLMPVSR